MICSYGGAGAVWDIFAREDAARLGAWLRDHADLFWHEGRPVSAHDTIDPILDQVRAGIVLCFRVDFHCVNLCLHS